MRHVTGLVTVFIICLSFTGTGNLLVAATSVGPPEAPTGILGLDIAGTQYDVSFHAYPFDDAFGVPSPALPLLTFNNESDVAVAAASIAAFLNDSSNFPTIIPTHVGPETFGVDNIWIDIPFLVTPTEFSARSLKYDILDPPPLGYCFQVHGLPYEPTTGPMWSLLLSKPPQFPFPRPVPSPLCSSVSLL